MCEAQANTCAPNHFRRPSDPTPWTSTPTPAPAGMIVAARVASPGLGRHDPKAKPPQARRRRRKIWAPKGPFPKKSSPPLTRTHREGSAVVAHSIGRSWPDGLLPPDAPAAPATSAAVPPCQQPCCRAFCTHDGSAAARQLVRRVRQGARRALAVFMMRARRVSAAVRRGAAAYGVAFRAFEEARTHGCLLSKRWIIGI